jgi:hypothetical protein
MSIYVRFDLACLALIGYLLLSILVYIRTCVKGEFKISYGKLGPTEARLIAIAANSLMLFFGNPVVKFLSMTLTVYDWIAIIVILLLFGVTIGSTVTQARILARMDP